MQVEHPLVTRAGDEQSVAATKTFTAQLAAFAALAEALGASALRAGLPASVAGMSVDRQCSSGLMATAIGAKQIVFDAHDIVVTGGVESISLVQNGHMNLFRAGLAHHLHNLF